MYENFITYIMKFEELRFLADMIMFRHIDILVSKEKYAEAFQIFENHFRTFRNKVKYNDTFF